MSEKSELQRLLATLPQVGRVEWIGLRPGRRMELMTVDRVAAVPGDGLVGDRYQGSGSQRRQVTLIQAEHLDAVGRMLGRDTIDPRLTRRNLVVSGINLLALKGRRFRVGGAVLEMTGACHPCSRMEENLGPGGYNAMRGHGGITARVLTAGEISLGDEVVGLASDEPLPTEEDE